MNELTANDTAALWTVLSFLLFYCLKAVHTFVKAQKAAVRKERADLDEDMRKLKEECDEIADRQKSKL